MTGKEKCAILKSIRVRLAELNNISYAPHPCNEIGNCAGTCSVCDAESKWLLSSMKELEKKGYPIIYTQPDRNIIQPETAYLKSNS